MNTQADNKIAVISGAFGYVGFEIAKSLSKQGFIIAALYKTSTEEIVAEKLTLLGAGYHKAYQCDLSHKESVDTVIDSIEKELGPIYAIIHAAGVIPKPKQLHLNSTTDLAEQFEVNVFGSFNFLASTARYLKEHGRGVMIGITTAGVITNRNTKARGAYSVVKFALQGMLVALKEELASYGVRVYSVAPGFMEGGMNSSVPRAFVEMMQHVSPSKTLTNAHLIAEKVAYLCSEYGSSETSLTLLMAPECEEI